MIAKETEKRPFISIIIPHLNGKHHLDVCLNSLYAQTFQDFEIIIADNGSTDGSVGYLEAYFPDVRVLELGINRGFTGACNAGYVASRGKLIILLNNDTEADKHWLAAIVDAFDRHPNVGSVASKMLLFDQRDIFHTAGDYYRFDGLPGNRGVWQKDTGQFDREEPVFSACGGAAAYRRELIDEVGFLDDDFYFSCEDIDLAWRAHLAGWDVLYVPKAVIYHKLKASGGSGVISSYHDGRNFLYVIWKNYPASLFRHHWPKILKAQIRISLAALSSWRGPASRARIRGQIAGLFGFFVMYKKRHKIQASRMINDTELERLLAPVDEGNQQR